MSVTVSSISPVFLVLGAFGPVLEREAVLPRIGTTGCCCCASVQFQDTPHSYFVRLGTSGHVRLDHAAAYETAGPKQILLS